MLRQRVITAVALLAIVVPAIFHAPPWVWGVVSLALLSAAGFEWGRLVGSRGQAVTLAVALALAGAAYLWMRHASPAGADPGAPGWVAVVAAGGVAFWASVAPVSLARARLIGPGLLIGAGTLSAAWIALYELRVHGSLVLVSAMAVVWLADIGAYFSGKAFGRRKLAPRISPGKSWEGAIGGGLLVLAVAAIVLVALPQAPAFPNRLAEGLPIALVALLLVVIAGFSVVGDLYESLLKRTAGVKDSGRLLPGHGGVLDRIDALIPTMPGCLLLVELLR
jgi:phosphatidate cytidylyltransferase